MRKTRTFFLGNLLPTAATNRAIINAAKREYPEGMLQGNYWYVFVKYRTNKVITPEEKYLFEGEKCLENLVHEIESRNSKAVVISFSKKDFAEFGSIIQSRRQWGISQQIDDNSSYIVHTYSLPPKPASPNPK